MIFSLSVASVIGLCVIVTILQIVPNAERLMLLDGWSFVSGLEYAFNVSINDITHSFTMFEVCELNFTVFFTWQGDFTHIEQSAVSFMVFKTFSTNKIV